MSRVASLLVAAVLVLGAACSREVEKFPPGQDPTTVQPGHPPGSGGGDGGADSGTTPTDSGADVVTACNATVLGGPLVDQNAVGGDPPAGTGGTIQDGTYNLTDATSYVGAGSVGPTGISFKATLEIAGGTMQEVRDTLNGGTTETRATYTISVSGTDLALGETCPTPSLAKTLSYTVQGSELHLIDATARTEFVYTLK